MNKEEELEELEEFDKLEEIYGIKEDSRKRRLFDNVTIEEFPPFTESENNDIDIEKDIQDEIENCIEKSIDDENEKNEVEN